VYPPLRSRKQTPNYGMEISDIASQKEVQNSAIGGKSDVGTLLGCTGTNFGALQESSTTVNSVHYSAMLWDPLKPTIRTRC
jgi:hypothetical protein